MRKPALRHGRTIWLHSKGSPAARHQPARGHYQTEIAIVGGGLTGAAIAEAFTRNGTEVIVLEAARIGHGSTAASTALLLKEPDLDLKELSAKYGSRAARRIWTLSATAANDLIDTLRRLRIDCDLAKRESLYYTLNDAHARDMRRELQRRHAAGFKGQWLDPATLLRKSGIRGAGAISTRGNAQLNPLKACAGLLDAAESAGARIFERTTINRIRHTKDRVRLYANGATIDAQQVVIATGYATKYFKPLAGRFAMRRTFVLATNPISSKDRRQLGIGPAMLWDTATPYHYVRWTPDHRLLLGGADRPVKPGVRRDAQFAEATANLREYFEQLFPGIGAVGIDTAWEGLFAMTPDGLPYIGPHRRYPRHSFAMGYGGNGMTFAALAARLLVEQWRGVTSADHELFAFNRPRSHQSPA